MSRQDKIVSRQDLGKIRFENILTRKYLDKTRSWQEKTRSSQGATLAINYAKMKKMLFIDPSFFYIKYFYCYSKSNNKTLNIKKSFTLECYKDSMIQNVTQDKI